MKYSSVPLPRMIKLMVTARASGISFMPSSVSAKPTVESVMIVM